MVAWVGLASAESPSFYRLTVCILGERSPKELFATPAYYWIKWTLLVGLAAVGGSVGVSFSRWRARYALLFLLGTLLVLATFAAIGFH